METLNIEQWKDNCDKFLENNTRISIKDKNDAYDCDILFVGDGKLYVTIVSNNKKGIKKEFFWENILEIKKFN